MPARGRFRALRVAIAGIAFIAGAAVIAVDIYVVLGMAAAPAGSMSAGATAMTKAFEKLHADLEGRGAAD